MLCLSFSCVLLTKPFFCLGERMDYMDVGFKAVDLSQEPIENSNKSSLKAWEEGFGQKALAESQGCNS